MQLIVRAKQVEMSPDIREYAETKAQKLTKYSNRIQTVEAIFTHESDQFSVEFIVRDDHATTFVAHDTGPDTFVLIDSVIDKLERQLRRHKELLKDHHANEAPKPSGLD